MILLPRRDGRLLFIRRGPSGPRPGYWSPPSGRIAPGEHPKEAVRREALEELGIEVEPLAEIWQSRSDDGRFRLRWWLVRSDASPRVASPEVAELAWVAPSELWRLSPHFPEHEEVLARIAGELFRP